MAKCCCCLSLKTGSYVVACYCIILGSLVLTSINLREKEQLQLLSNVTKMVNHGLDNVLKTLDQKTTVGGNVEVHTGASNANFQPLLTRGRGREEGMASEPITPFPQVMGPAATLRAKGKAILAKAFSFVEKVMKVIYGVNDAIYGGWLLTSLLLILGLRMNWLPLLLPWLFYTIFLTGTLLLNFIIGVALLAVFTQFNTPTGSLPAGPWIVLILFPLLISVLNIYSCRCVWTFHQQRTREIKINVYAGVELDDDSDELDLKPILTSEDVEHCEKIRLP